MKKMSKNFKICIIGIILLLLLVVIPATIYLCILPTVVSNPNFLEYVQKKVKDSCGAELIIQNPVLKTSPKLSVTFVSDNILLTKDGKTLLSIDKLNCGLSIRKIFAKKVILDKLGADDFYADINELQKLTLKEGEEQKPSDFQIKWFNSILYLKKCMILYKTSDNVLVKVFARDLEITKAKNPKYIHFSVLTDIEYDNQKFRLMFKDFNRIYIKNKKVIVKPKAQSGTKRE